jgi:sulfatase maturation enzyme AslB (radical SAM superfamily)
MTQEYRLFDGIRVINEPYFSRQGKNKNIGLYHPINNEIYYLTKTEWNTLAAIIKRKPKDVNQKHLQMLEKNLIIHKNDEQIKIELDYNPDNAQMYVKLTEACNFSCPGCTTSIDRIPLNKAITLNLAKLETYLESFARSANEKKMKTIKIKWAGGEPLLKMSYDLILQAQNKINELKNKYPSLYIKQIVLTNGVFLDEKKAIFFKQNNISLSVSLWGTGSVQDNSRKPRNKMETYEVITKNITKRIVHNTNE